MEACRFGFVQERRILTLIVWLKRDPIRKGILCNGEASKAMPVVLFLAFLLSLMGGCAL